MVDVDDRTRLRRGFEGVMRVAKAGGGLAVSTAHPYHPSVAAYLPAPETTPLPELTPLEQLALSVFLGEAVPPRVLLSALEDEGVYPNGVLAAAEEAEAAALDFGTPEYVEGEDRWDGYQRFRELADGWYRGQLNMVRGVCTGVFGSGNGTIGTMFRRFLNRWLGFADGRPYSQSRYPTNAWLGARMDSFPPLARVFRELLKTSPAKTAARLEQLVANLERR